MKAIYYKIVTGYTSELLEQAVNEQIASGLEPIGGVSYMPLPPGSHLPFLFCQAMIQYDGADTSAPGLTIRA